jgi:hypothetical protein
MKRQRLPPYIVEFIQTVNRGEVFEVDPVRIPKGWKYERVRIPDEDAAAVGIHEPHWMVTVSPESFRRAFKGWRPWCYCVARVGPYSYNFPAPMSLLPGGPEEIQATMGEAPPQAPSHWPPSKEVA